MIKEFRLLNNYLGNQLNILINYCKLRTTGFQQWRNWVDDWGNELIIKSRREFEIKKNNKQSITDIYFLSDLKEIERISMVRIKKGDYLALLGRDGTLRVFKGENRISPLSIGLNKLQQIIEEIEQEEIEQSVKDLVIEPLELRPRRPLKRREE